MTKILITGNAGSGKTTFAEQLAKLLGRKDVIGLDKIVWKPGWALSNNFEKEHEFQKIIAKETWIVEGVSKTILEAADTIIFLDFPRYKCYWRALKRNWKFAFKSRPELPEKCPEILIIGTLVNIIWNFPKVVKPDIVKHITNNPHKTIFHITNSRELETAIRALSKFNKTAPGSIFDG